MNTAMIVLLNSLKEWTRTAVRFAKLDLFTSYTVNVDLDIFCLNGRMIEAQTVMFQPSERCQKIRKYQVYILGYSITRAVL